MKSVQTLVMIALLGQIIPALAQKSPPMEDARARYQKAMQLRQKTLDRLPPRKSYEEYSFSNSDWAENPKGQKTKLNETQLADAVTARILSNLYVATDSHFHEGEFDHTINLHRIVAQGDPANLETYENSGWLLWSTDRRADAVALMKQGIAANPNSFSLYDELGSYYFRWKEYAKAIVYLEKAVKFPCPAATWHTLANSYQHTNQKKKALGIWKLCVAKFKDDALAPPRVKRLEAELAKENSR